MIPRTTEALDQPSNVPDLCSNASDSVFSQNGEETTSKTENGQKKFIIKNTGNYKVASRRDKYMLTKKTINATQVRTSALSNSLKRSKFCKSPQTQLNKQVADSSDASPNRSKSGEEVVHGFPSTPPDRRLRDADNEGRDTVRYLRDTNRRLFDTDPKLRDTDRKVHGHNKTSELLSQSLPAYGSTTTKGSSQRTSPRKRPDQGYSSVQRKICQNAEETDRNTPKPNENGSQPVLSTGLSRSPTPKMFFNNLINRLSGRLSGNSPSSSMDSRSSSSSSSRASTPTLMEQNVALSFRLSADEFSSCDHKLKLYFEVSLFRWGSHEEFRCLLKVRFLREMGLFSSFH